MWNSTFTEAPILVVDDQEANIRLLERLLQRDGYTAVTSTTDPRQVLPLYAGLQPDLILLDLHMPHLDGVAVMRQLATVIPAETYLPVLVLTADATPETKQRALAAGAKDFLTKPFDPIEVLLRIRNLLATRLLYRQLQEQNQTLEARVRERTSELEAAQREILARLALAAEYRDDSTGQHTRRVGQVSAVLAQALGLPPYLVDLIRQAAPLHDVGKIGIPDPILLKPGKLTAAEFEQMKQHTAMGGHILGNSRYPLLYLAEEIAYTHHERWDGAGYPLGLSGEGIPIAGRIVAVADTFDALTHERPYKAAWSVDEALAEIERQSGRQFDPAVVAQLRQNLPQILAILTAASDRYATPSLEDRLMDLIPSDQSWPHGLTA